LDTEVSATTKARDLIKVKTVTKAAVGHRTSVTDNRSAAKSTVVPPPTTNTASTPSPIHTSGPIPLESGNRDDATAFVDLSSYEQDIQEEEHEITEEDIEAILNDDGETVDVFDDGCPYSWEERKEWATEALYDADAQGDNRLLITQLNELDMKDVLGKFLIEVTDEDKAKTEFASYYDAIFPEGFALGIQHGYSIASDEFEATTQDEDNREEELLNRVDELELAVKAKDKAMAKIAAKYQKIELRRKELLKQLSTIGPIYRYLIRKRGCMDESNRPDKQKIIDLLKEAQEDNKKAAEKIADKIGKANKALVAEV